MEMEHRAISAGFLKGRSAVCLLLWHPHLLVKKTQSPNTWPWVPSSQGPRVLSANRTLQPKWQLYFRLSTPLRHFRSYRPLFFFSFRKNWIFFSASCHLFSWGTSLRKSIRKWLIAFLFCRSSSSFIFLWQSCIIKSCLIWFFTYPSVSESMCLRSPFSALLPLNSSKWENKRGDSERFEHSLLLQWDHNFYISKLEG